MPKPLWVVGLSSLLAAGCSSDRVLAPLAQLCTQTSAGQVSLGIGADTAIDLAQTSGCAVFPANLSGATFRYLVVPQSASSMPNTSEAFKLVGNPLGTMLVPPPAPSVGGLPSVAQRYDLQLRRIEQEFATRVSRPPRAPSRVTAAPTPVDSGQVSTFRVCKVLTCDPRNPGTLDSVTATALKVGQHIAIFVDNAAPQPGLTQADLNALRTLFDTRLYELDTLAFGAESDIDNNGMVIVLMTGQVNALVNDSTCTSPTGGYVAGYFFGADLITIPPFATGNNGEIFYSIVPDPTGTLSCSHGVAEVRQTVPVTFVHEFQHMISFNQHFLQREVFPEDLWLNEGLSHYAEELGGRSFLPDTAAFCAYVRGDLLNASQYLATPESYFLVDTAGIGGLANRGAYWLFVRYLVDQLAVGPLTADSVTRRLVMTPLIGAANVSSAAGGTPFETLLERWALANYVSDLPAFSPPSELQYVSWRFRTAYPRFNAVCSNRIPAQFPLAPAAATASALNASGVLRAGSGAYYIAQQDPGTGGFTLQVSGSGRLLFARYNSLLSTGLVPRLNVIRLQ
jgi:hypothetical protein